MGARQAEAVVGAVVLARRVRGPLQQLPVATVAVASDSGTAEEDAAGDREEVDREEQEEDA